ncbi:YtxH domain-containing protein [Virgibacillus sp. L01]|uniref:YtxH domain-containing protein n=1 Tax=Virgibacillus sp. L01 TaxID=3457429 RepID=UPI003FD5214F
MAEQTKNMVKQKKVVTGTVAGAIVGATASLLLAPKPGKEIRTDITNKVETGKEKTRQFNDKTKAKLDDFKNNSKQVKEKLSHKNNDNSASSKDEYTSQHPGELHSEKMADAQGDNKQESETTKQKPTSSKKTASGNYKSSGTAKKSNSSTQSQKQTAAK